MNRRVVVRTLLGQVRVRSSDDVLERDVCASVSKEIERRTKSDSDLPSRRHHRNRALENIEVVLVVCVPGYLEFLIELELDVACSRATDIPDVEDDEDFLELKIDYDVGSRLIFTELPRLHHLHCHEDSHDDCDEQPTYGAEGLPVGWPPLARIHVKTITLGRPPVAKPRCGAGGCLKGSVSSVLSSVQSCTASDQIRTFTREASQLRKTQVLESQTCQHRRG